MICRTGRCLALLNLFHSATLWLIKYLQALFLCHSLSMCIMFLNWTFKHAWGMKTCLSEIASPPPKKRETGCIDWMELKPLSDIETPIISPFLFMCHISLYKGVLSNELFACPWIISHTIMCCLCSNCFFNNLLFELWLVAEIYCILWGATALTVQSVHLSFFLLANNPSGTVQVNQCFPGVVFLPFVLSLYVYGFLKQCFHKCGGFFFCLS